jgi:response regulator NasT
MEKRKLSENDAYAAMRTMAMKQKISIKDVADNILSVACLFDE